MALFFLKRSFFYFIFAIFLLSVPSFASKSKWDDYRADWSKLMVTIYNGEDDKALSLISKGVNINYESPGSYVSAMGIAIRKENVRITKALLKTGKMRNLNDYIIAAAGRNKSDLVRLLIQYGASPNFTLENGYSVLMMAASFGSYETMKTLLEQGANVEQKRTVDGMTPLMFAAFNGHYEKVKLLLQYGADKYAKDENGHRAYIHVFYIYQHMDVSCITKIKLLFILI